MRIRSRCSNYHSCHWSTISCQQNGTQTSILYFKMLSWWKEWRRRTPHVFHVGTSQCTIGTVALVAWPSRVQVQVKMHVEMTLPVVLLASKNSIATQWLQSLLDRLDNDTNHKQIFQNWQIPTARHCQSKDAAGFVMDQATVEQTPYIQIRKIEMRMERKDWIPCTKDMCHWKNWKKSSLWSKTRSGMWKKGCYCW